MNRRFEEKSRRKCRIGHVVQNLGIGGLERIVVTLMDKVDPERFSSSVYCLGDGGKLMTEVKEEGHQATALGKRSGIDYRLPFRMARLFKHNEIDIVHCHNFGGVFYGSLAALLMRKVSVVYTAHGPVFPHRRRHAWFQRMPIVDRVITVSDFVRDSAIEQAGLSADKVITITNGIDVESLAPPNPNQITQMRNDMGFGSGGPIIGLVARMSPEKDHNTLLEAFRRVVAKIATARLVLVGGGELLEELQEKAHGMGLVDSVVFLGERRDIAPILWVFDVFALSSKEEGLGITLLEAMAAGVPVVATEVGGIPEIVQDGVTGKLVSSGDPASLADSILWMLANPGGAEAMASKARTFVNQRYGVEQMISKYETVYQEVHQARH